MGTHHNVNRMIKTFLLIACVIAATSEDDVVPEYEHDKHKLTFEDTNLADLPAQLTEMLANGRSEQECLALADATETEVNSSVAAQQRILDGMDKGQNCNGEMDGAVQQMQDNLDKAKKATEAAVRAYNSANSKKFNFGDFSLNALKAKSCDTFWKSNVYTTQIIKAKAAEDAKLKAKGDEDGAAKSLKDIKKRKTEAVIKCHCDIKKKQEETIKKMNAEVKTANENAYKKAAYLRCIIKKIPEKDCKKTVKAIPTVKAVTLSVATQATYCGPEFSNTFTFAGKGHCGWQGGDKYCKCDKTGRVSSAQSCVAECKGYCHCPNLPHLAQNERKGRHMTAQHCRKACEALPMCLGYDVRGGMCYPRVASVDDLNAARMLVPTSKNAHLKRYFTRNHISNTPPHNVAKGWAAFCGGPNDYPIFGPKYSPHAPPYNSRVRTDGLKDVPCPPVPAVVVGNNDGSSKHGA